MTPPVLLTAPTGPLNANPLNVHYTKLPPFGAILAHPPYPGPFSTATVPPSTGGSALGSECDARDPDASRTNRAPAHARQWTGAPIRAIAPLPRRKHSVMPDGVQPNAGVRGAMHSSANAPANNTAVGPPPRRQARAARFLDDVDTDTDSGGEIEEGDGDRDVEGRNAPSGSRHCSYESITAAEGLSAWSFEELRVECYAQSLVARGTKPPPVVQPSLAIPPAFVPRIVPRS